MKDRLNNIDTFRYLVVTKTICSKFNFLALSEISDVVIKHYVKDRVKIKNIKVAKVGNGKDLSNYLILYSNDYTVKKSLKAKKSKYYYSVLIHTRLNQLYKGGLNSEIVEFRDKLLHRYKKHLISVDFAIDYEVEFSNLVYVIDRLKAYGKIKLYLNTYYISNNIKIYDKSYKEELDYPLTRVEFTFKVGKTININYIYNKVNNIYKQLLK